MYFGSKESFYIVKVELTYTNIFLHQQRSIKYIAWRRIRVSRSIRLPSRPSGESTVSLCYHNNHFFCEQKYSVVESYEYIVLNDMPKKETERKSLCHMFFLYFCFVVIAFTKVCITTQVLLCYKTNERSKLTQGT